ncbi:MAG: hypothetical protein AB9882_06455 [Ignavibacteriaceae bacterium]
MKTAKILMFVICFTSLAWAQIGETVKNFPEGIEVISRYIDSIGGAENYLSVQDKKIEMGGKVQGMDLTLEVFYKSPNKLMQRTSVAGMEQILSFDGEKGYQKAMTEEVELTGDELEMVKIEATGDAIVFPEKYGLKYNVKDTVSLPGGTAYKLEKVYPGGSSGLEYYDLLTGLRVKEERTIDTPQGVLNQVIHYSDYRDVEGVKFPFKVVQEIQGMRIELIVKTVELNKGLKDSIFMKD